MTRFRAALLAAAVTAGLPAMAFAQDRTGQEDYQRAPGGMRDSMGGGPRRGDVQRFDEGQPRGRQADRGDQGDRVRDRPQPQQPPQQVQQPQPQPPGTQDRGDRSARGAQGGQDRGGFDRDRDRDGRSRDGIDRGGQYRNEPDRGGNFGGQYRGNEGRLGNDRRFGAADRPDRRFGNEPRFGGQRPGGDWRQDRRYDWRGYREQNRNLFRAGRYVAPRGWSYGYRRFSIGVRLPSFFFGQQYWIADPYAYRLPPAYGPYRWVRYYDDVLLIDLRSGEVVDAIPGFFF